jgi:hypothetical protein
MSSLDLLVVLSIKTVGSILFPAVPFHVNKTCAIPLGFECFNPNFSI